MVDWEIRTGNVRKENHDITKVLPSEGFLKNWKFDIVNDPCFNEANNVFLAMCTKKRQRCCGVQWSHKYSRSSKPLYFIQLRGSQMTTTQSVCGLNALFQSVKGSD